MVEALYKLIAEKYRKNRKVYRHNRNLSITIPKQALQYYEMLDNPHDIEFTEEGILLKPVKKEG